jgi:hypothetical protein
MQSVCTSLQNDCVRIFLSSIHKGADTVSYHAHGIYYFTECSQIICVVLSSRNLIQLTHLRIKSNIKS